MDQSSRDQLYRSHESCFVKHKAVNTEKDYINYKFIKTSKMHKVQYWLKKLFTKLLGWLFDFRMENVKNSRQVERIQLFWLLIELPWLLRRKYANKSSKEISNESLQKQQHVCEKKIIWLFDMSIKPLSWFWLNVSSSWKKLSVYL